MSTLSSRRIISRRDADDEDRERLLQQSAERLRALGPLDDVESGAAAHFALEPARRRGPDADHEVRSDRDDDDAQAGVEHPSNRALPGCRRTACR